MKPYVKLNRLADYLYTIEYTSFDYEYAYRFMRTRYAPQNAGACSAVYSDNGLFGKNFDWFYSTDVEFVVINRGGNYDTIGVAGAVPTLNKEFVESGEDSEMYKILPFMINDGMNNAGVFAGLNVVPNGDAGKTTGTNPTSTKPPISAMMLPRYILDRCGSAKEAVWTIQNLNIYCPHNDNLEEEVHLIVGDIHNQYLIEFINNKTVVIELTENKWVTNYYRHGAEFLANGHLDWQTLTPHANGTHRSDIIADAFAGNTELYVDDLKVLMREKLAYTNMYTDNAWMDELCADYGTSSYGDLTQTVLHNNPSAFNAVYASAQTRYQNRERDDKKTWQTCHSNIYDIETLRLNVVVDEDGVEFDMDMTGNTKPVVNKVIAPCGGLELDESAFDVKYDVDGKKYITVKNNGGADIDEYLKKANIVDGSLVLTNKEDQQTVYQAPLKDAKIEDGKLIITKKDDTEVEFEGGNVKTVHFTFKENVGGILYYDSDVSESDIRAGMQQGIAYVGLLGSSLYTTDRDYNYTDFNCIVIRDGKACTYRLTWDNSKNAWKSSSIIPEEASVIQLEYRSDNRVYKVGDNYRLHAEEVYAMAVGEGKKAVLLRDVTDGSVYKLTTLNGTGTKCYFSGCKFDRDDSTGRDIVKFVEIHDDRNSYECWVKNEKILTDSEYTLYGVDNISNIQIVSGSLVELFNEYGKGNKTRVKLNDGRILEITNELQDGLGTHLEYTYVTTSFPCETEKDDSLVYTVSKLNTGSYTANLTRSRVSKIVDGGIYAVIKNAVDTSHVVKYNVTTTYDNNWQASGDIDLVSCSDTEIIFAGVLMGVNTLDATEEPEPVDVVVRVKSGVTTPDIYVSEQKHHCVRIIDKSVATYENIMEAVEDAETVYVKVNEVIQDEDSSTGSVVVRGLVPVYHYNEGCVLCCGTLPAYESGSNPDVFWIEHFVSFYNIYIRREPNGGNVVNSFTKVDMGGKGKTFNATETAWRSEECVLDSSESYKDIKKACDEGLLNGINLSYYKYQEDQDGDNLTTEFMWYDGTFTPSALPLMYFTNKHGDILAVGYDETQDVGTMQFRRVKHGAHEYNHAEDFEHLIDIGLDYDYIYYQFGETRQRIEGDQTVTDIYIGQLPFQQSFTNNGVRTVMFSGIVTGHKANTDTVINPYVVSVMFDEGSTTERIVWMDAEDDGMNVIYANVEDIASTDEAKHKGEVEDGDLDILFNQFPIKAPTVLYLKSEADENILLKFWHIDNVNGKAVFQRQIGDYRGKVTIDKTTEEVVYTPFESTDELVVFDGSVEWLHGIYRDGDVTLIDSNIEDLLDAVQNNKRTIIRIIPEDGYNRVISCIYSGFGTCDSGHLGISGNAYNFYGIEQDMIAPSVGVLVVSLVYTEWNDEWHLIYQWRKTQNSTGINSIKYEDLGGNYDSPWAYEQVKNRQVLWGTFDYMLLDVSGIVVDDTVSEDKKVYLNGRLPMSRDNKYNETEGLPVIFSGIVEGYSETSTDAPTQFTAIVHLYEDNTKDIQLIPINSEDTILTVEVVEETENVYKMIGENNESIAHKYFELSKNIRLSVTKLDGTKLIADVEETYPIWRYIEFSTVSYGTFIVDGDKINNSYIDWKESNSGNEILIIPYTATTLQYEDGTRGERAYHPYWNIDVSSLTNEEKKKLSDGKYKAVRVQLDVDMFHSTGVIVEAYSMQGGLSFWSENGEEYYITFTKSGDQVVSGRVIQIYHLTDIINIDDYLNSQDRINRAGGVLANRYASNTRRNPSTVTLAVPTDVLPVAPEPTSYDYIFITYQCAGQLGLYHGTYRTNDGRDWDAYIKFTNVGTDSNVEYNIEYIFEEKPEEDHLYIGDVSTFEGITDEQAFWSIPFSALPDGTKEKFDDFKYKYITVVLKADTIHPRAYDGNFLVRFTMVDDLGAPEYKADEAMGTFYLMRDSGDYLIVYGLYSAENIVQGKIDSVSDELFLREIYECKIPTVTLPVYKDVLPDTPSVDKEITFTRGIDGKYHGVYSTWEAYGSQDSQSRKLKEWDAWLNITKFKDDANNTHYGYEYMFEECVEVEDKVLTISHAQLVSYNDGTKGSDAFLPYWDIDLTTLTDEEKQKLSEGKYDEVRLKLRPDMCHRETININLYKTTSTTTYVTYASNDGTSYSAEFLNENGVVESGRVKLIYCPDEPIYINELLNSQDRINRVGGILANYYDTVKYRNPSIVTLVMREEDLPPTGQNYDHVTYQFAGRLGLYRGVYKARDGKVYNIWMKFTDDGAPDKQFSVEFTYEEVVENDEILYIKDELEPVYPTNSAMYWDIDMTKLSDEDKTKLSTKEYKSVILTLKSSYFNNHTITLSFDKDMNMMNYYSSTSPVYKIVTSGTTYARVFFECSPKDTIYMTTLDVNNAEEMRAFNYSIMTGGLSDMPARVVTQVANYPASWGTAYEAPLVVFNRYEFLKYRGECEHEGEMYDVYLIKEATDWTVNFVKQEKCKCKTFVLDAPIACDYSGGSIPLWNAKNAINSIANEIMEYNNNGWEHRIIFKAVANDRFHADNRYDTLIFDRCSFDPDVKRVRYYNDGGLDELEIVYTDTVSSATIARRYTPEEIVYLDKSSMSLDSSYSPKFVKMLERIAGTSMPTTNIKLKASELVGAEVTPDITFSVNLEPQINTSDSDTSVRTVWIGHVTYADKNYKVEVNNKLYGNLQCIITREVEEEELKTVFHTFEINADASEPQQVILKGDTVSDVRRCLEKAGSPVFIADKFANDVLAQPYISPISFGARTFATNGGSIQGDVYNIDAISERGDKIYLAVETDKITVRSNAEVDVNGMTFVVKESVIGTQSENSSISEYVFNYLEGKNANIQLKRNNGDIVMLTGATEPVVPPVIAGMNISAIGFSGVDIDPVAGNVSDVLLELIRMEDTSTGGVGYSHNIEVQARADSNTLVVPTSKLRLPDKTIGIGSGTRLKIRNHALANGDVVLKLGGMEVFDGIEWHTINGMDTIFVSSVNTLETDNKLQFNNANGEALVMTINADGTGEVASVNLNYGNAVLNIDGNYLTDTFEAERQAIAKFILETYTAGDIYSSGFPDFQNYIALGDIKELFGESEFKDDMTAVTLSSKRLRLDGEERVVYSGLAQNDNGENRLISVIFSKLAGDSEYNVVYKCEPLSGEDDSLKTFVTSAVVNCGYDDEGNAVWNAIDAMASIKADVFKAIKEDKPHRIRFYRVTNDKFHKGDYTPMMFEKASSPYTYIDENGNTLELTLNSATITGAVIKRKYTSNDDIYFDRYEMTMPDRVIDYTKRFNQMIMNLGYNSDIYDTAMPRASFVVSSGYFDEDSEDDVWFEVTLEPFANMSEPYDYLQMEWRGEVDCKGIKYLVVVDNKHELIGERILQFNIVKMEESDCKVAFVTKSSTYAEVKALVDDGKQVFLKLDDDNYNSATYEGITGAHVFGVIPLTHVGDDEIDFMGDATIVHSSVQSCDITIGYMLENDGTNGYVYENIDVYNGVGYRYIDVYKTPTVTRIEKDTYLDITGKSYSIKNVFDTLNVSLKNHTVGLYYDDTDTDVGEILFFGKLVGLEYDGTEGSAYVFSDGTNKVLVKHVGADYTMEYVKGESECNTAFVTKSSTYAEVKALVDDGKEVFLKLNEDDYTSINYPAIENTELLGTIPLIHCDNDSAMFYGDVIVGFAFTGTLLCGFASTGFEYGAEELNVFKDAGYRFIDIDKTTTATTVTRDTYLDLLGIDLAVDNVYNNTLSSHLIKLWFTEKDSSNTVIHSFVGSYVGTDENNSLVFFDGTDRVLIKHVGTAYTVEFVERKADCYAKTYPVIVNQDSFRWDEGYHEFTAHGGITTAQWALDLAEALASGARPDVRIKGNLGNFIGWTEYGFDDILTFDSAPSSNTYVYTNAHGDILKFMCDANKNVLGASISISFKDRVCYVLSIDRLVQHDEYHEPSYAVSLMESMVSLQHFGEYDIEVRDILNFLEGVPTDYFDAVSGVLKPMETSDLDRSLFVDLRQKWSGILQVNGGTYQATVRTGIDRVSEEPKVTFNAVRIGEESEYLHQLVMIDWHDCLRDNNDGTYGDMYEEVFRSKFGTCHPWNAPQLIKVLPKKREIYNDFSYELQEEVNRMYSRAFYELEHNIPVFDIVIDPKTFYNPIIGKAAGISDYGAGGRKSLLGSHLYGMPSTFKYVGFTELNSGDETIGEDFQVSAMEWQDSLGDSIYICAWEGKGFIIYKFNNLVLPAGISLANGDEYDVYYDYDVSSTAGLRLFYWSLIDASYNASWITGTTTPNIQLDFSTTHLDQIVDVPHSMKLTGRGWVQYGDIPEGLSNLTSIYAYFFNGITQINPVNHGTCGYSLDTQFILYPPQINDATGQAMSYFVAPEEYENMSRFCYNDNKAYWRTLF